MARLKVAAVQFFSERVSNGNCNLLVSDWLHVALMLRVFLSLFSSVP